MCVCVYTYKSYIQVCVRMITVCLHWLSLTSFIIYMTYLQDVYMKTDK